MKTIIYLSSATDARHLKMLEHFWSGVKENGDDCILIEGPYQDNGEDINVIFGSWKDRPDLHHVTKRSVVSSGKPFVVIETPLIGRGRVTNVLQDNWYRIGVGGFLADTGNFNNTNRPGDRWNKIQKELNVQLLPWSNHGDHIVVVLQLPGDASLRGANISRWACTIIELIRQRSGRNIILRTSQLERQYDQQYIDKALSFKNVTLQKGTKENLNDTIDNSLFTVSYSSGFGIDSVIRGKPVLVGDPGSFVYKDFNNSLDNIFVKPNQPDRTQWLNDISYAQWHVEEMGIGLPWRHLKGIL